MPSLPTAGTPPPPYPQSTHRDARTAASRYTTKPVQDPETMYLITIPVTRKFDAAKALADALEYGRLNEPAKSWTVVGMAVSASDARIMAQAVANDRNSVVEIRLAVISSGNHYGYTEIKPEPKPEPKPADEPAITGSDIEWEPYDGVPADTTGFPTTEELLARDTF